MAKLKVAAIVLVTLVLACLADGLLSRAHAEAVSTPLREQVTPPAAPTFQAPTSLIAIAD